MVKKTEIVPADLHANDFSDELSAEETRRKWRRGESRERERNQIRVMAEYFIFNQSGKRQEEESASNVKERNIYENLFARRTFLHIQSTRNGALLCEFAFSN